MSFITFCRFPYLTLCFAPLLMGSFLRAQETGSDAFVETARITARLGFLKSTWQREHVEHDPVNTQIMDAFVTGQQTTSVSVRLAAESCERMAHLVLVGTGTVQSSTVGRTREAQVDSVGSHAFTLVKPVFFDGNRFLTRRTHGRIDAGSRPFRVRTIVSGIPLLGEIGEQIAWSETLRRQPMTDSITAQRVAEDLVPDFDSAVDRELQAANRGWNDIRSEIDQLLPGSTAWQALSSSENLTLRIGYQESGGTQSAARPLLHTTMKTDPEVVEDLVVSVSQRMIDDLLGTLPLRRLVIPDSSLEDLAKDPSVLSGKSSSALARMAERAPVLFSLELASSAPLTVRFEKGRVGIVLRFRVLPKIGAATGIHRLTVWLDGADRGNGTWSVGIADVDVTAEDRDSEPAITQLIATQSKTMLMALPPSDIPRLAEISALTKLPDLRLWSVRSRDGILRVSFQMTSGR